MNKEWMILRIYLKDKPCFETDSNETYYLNNPDCVRIDYEYTDGSFSFIQKLDGNPSWELMEEFIIDKDHYTFLITEKDALIGLFVLFKQVRCLKFCTTSDGSFIGITHIWFNDGNSSKQVIRVAVYSNKEIISVNVYDTVDVISALTEFYYKTNIHLGLKMDMPVVDFLASKAISKQLN